MGCDIHLYVETFDGKRWVSADKTGKDEYDKRRTVVTEPFYEGRNYSLFSILADVRNGYGFAGVPTGTGFVPMFKPRGLPADASPFVRKECELWAGDGHSHSWATVAELHAYDWTQVTERQGVLDASVFRDWNRWNRARGESPESWCGSIMGRDIQIVTCEEMDRRIKAFEAKHDGAEHGEKDTAFAEEFKNIHVQATWKQPYYKCVEPFLSRCLPRLWRLGSPEKVRIVFWFDN